MTPAGNARQATTIPLAPHMSAGDSDSALRTVLWAGETAQEVSAFANLESMAAGDALDRPPHATPPNCRVSRRRRVPWTKGTGSRGHAQDRQSPSALGARGLSFRERDCCTVPRGDLLLLPAQLGKAHLGPWLLASSSSSWLHCWGQVLATRAGNFPFAHPVNLLLKVPKGFLQEGRQATICDLEFTYPRTWSSRVQWHLDSSVQIPVWAYLHPSSRLCLVSASQRDCDPHQVKNTGL